MKQEYTKAVVYCRVSSEKQVREGNGLDSQEHRCREYAANLGLEVESVFRDEGISGSLFARPAMKGLIKYLDQHWQTKYVVIFDDLKRFARDVEVHIKLKAQLMRRDAKLECLNYHFDDSAEGEFVETIFAAQNQLERKQNKRQVCQKMKARIERGYWCFPAPSGYEYRKDKEHGKLLFPIHPAVDIIAEGLNKFADNRLAKQIDLLEFYRSENLAELLGWKKIDKNFVKRVITEILYTGELEYPEWGIPRRPGHHESIITPETYNMIKDKIKRRERKPRETDNLEFPLRRVVSCSVCGKPLTGSTCRGKYKYYAHYTCNNKACAVSPKNVPVAKLEEDYLQLLDNIKIDQEAVEMVRVAATKIWQKKMKGVKNQNAGREKEIKEIEEQIDEYIKLMPTTKSENIKARYEAKIEGLDSRVKELEENLEIKKVPNFDEALKLTLNFLRTPAKIWKKADRKLKIMIHNMIFTENPTYCLQTGFGTPKLSLPFYINQYLDVDGGPKEARTPDLIHAMDARYQLRYGPNCAYYTENIN